MGLGEVCADRQLVVFFEIALQQGRENFGSGSRVPALEMSGGSGHHGLQRRADHGPASIPSIQPERGAMARERRSGRWVLVRNPIYCLVSMRMTAAGATDPGPRPSNQDAYFVDLELGLLVVADGMGGHNAGDVASRMAIGVVVDFVRATHDGREITWPFPLDLSKSLLVNRVEMALRLANRRVRDAGERDLRHAGMGTTIVAALVEGDHIAIGHVGDSRAYVLRGRELVQLTVDHTWLNAVLGADAVEAATHPMRHVLTHGIGMGADVVPSVIEERLHPGERWLICTDGVHGCLDHTALASLMQAAAPAAIADDAVRRAVVGGTLDNATAVVLNVD